MRTETDQLFENDKQLLLQLFKKKLGYELDLNNPRTFNEKLQWLKLYIRKPEMVTMVDKYKVREYLIEKGCTQYLNELIKIYHSSNEIVNEWEQLPQQFVVKVNHWSGGGIIVKDKDTFDKTKLTTLDHFLSQNYYDTHKNGEWPYKDIHPVIVVERYLEDSEGKLLDYKFFCFDGVPHYVQIDVDRFTNHTRCFYDLDWKKQEFTTAYPLFTGEIKKPENLDEMVELAKKLSEGYPHLRVDLYNIDDKRIIFGELTFYHGSGTEKFYPEIWDYRLGKLIHLPIIEAHSHDS